MACRSLLYLVISHNSCVTIWHWPTMGGGEVMIKDTLARVYPYHMGPCPCITRAIWRGWGPISQYQWCCHMKSALPLIKRLATASDRAAPISQCVYRFLLETALPSVERLAAASDCSSGSGDQRRFMTWHTCDWLFSSRLIAHKHDTESELSHHDQCRYNYITQ